MTILRGAALAALALSCGSTQRAPTPGTESTAGAVQVKTYGPLGARTDSKLPRQAVILGTDEHNGSTIVPIPATQAQALVDAMFVREGGKDPATGGMTPVKLSTAPNPDQSVQVGVFEEMAGGTGPQWRAGVWVSAIVAATTLNKDLTDFTFSASSGGFIDGASASGLMAGGFLAAITGAPVDPKATMTGTINPDGSIGPVAGIPEKFLGSIDKGKRRLGYPIGMRFAKSEATGGMVDLVQLAKDHGAEAVEVADVHEAYRLLTGRTLPEPVPVTEADMALDPATDKALEAKYQQWQKQVAADWATIVQLDNAGRMPKVLGLLRDYTKQNVDAAERLHKRGAIAGAYSRMLAAAAYALGTTKTAEILSKVQAGDVAGAKAVLEHVAAEPPTSADTFRAIGKLKPTTLGGHLAMMSAFKAALEGWVFGEFAARAVTAANAYLDSLKAKTAAELGAPSTADELVGIIAPTVMYEARRTAETTLAMHELEFEAAESVNYMCSIPNVRRMATSFQSASSAGLNYFDTLLVEPVAKANNMSDDDARQRIAMVEPDYLVAYMASKLGDSDGLPKELKSQWGERSLAWSLYTLAGSELAYYDASQLIAKYYSLGVTTDDQGKVSAIEHDKAFMNMLAAADKNARASARAARIAAGAIPIQAKLAYQLAMVQKDGDLTEKLDALAELWVSSAMSQSAVMLARN
ncbi:MAG TPA: hypothetical protein VMJ10_00040 [Kofleriaceae bacterium]|nr:hypothetical protein [Kofleriaceae bacterium]